MGNYYFLAASLPPLSLGQKPEITFEELKSRLEINLSKEDLAKVRTLLLFTDLQNIRALLSEEPIDPRGNLDEKELDEALLTRSILPDYVFDFFDKFENLSERMRNFFGLLASFFTTEIPQQKGFLKRYLRFEKEWRLVMLALRAKELKRDVIRELQFEDLSDTLVAQILAQKDAASYDPPPEWHPLKELMVASGADPWQRYKAFTTWRFKKIEEMVEKPLFSIDWILGYITQLMLVEHWNELDANKGKMILESLKTG